MVEYVEEDNMRLIDIYLDDIEELTIGAMCSVQIRAHMKAKMFCHVLSYSRGQM
jgi:hypothetical protein